MIYRSFGQVWQDIGKLEGKNVSTLCRNYKNYIQEVNAKGVVRCSNMGTRKPKSVRKSEFQKIWNNLVKDRKCEYNEGNWAIAFACIAQLPEVEYSCKDGKLSLYLMSKNTHCFGQTKEC